MTGEERIPNKGKGKYPLPPPPPRLPDSPPNKRLKLIPAQGVRPRGPQHDKDGGGSSSSTSRGKGKGRGESSVASKSFKPMTAFSRGSAAVVPPFEPPQNARLKPLPIFNSSAATAPIPPAPPFKIKRELVTPPRPTAFFSPRRGSPPKLQTPISSRANSLFESIEQIDNKPNLIDRSNEWRRITTAPKIPADEAEEWDGMDSEGMILNWSPKKKRTGGYLVAGLASLASSRIKAAKTEHTLWIHHLSRLITNQTKSLSRLEFAKIVQPTICFKVIEVLSFGELAAESSLSLEDNDPVGTSAFRQGNKIGLAVCQIMRQYHQCASPSLEKDGVAEASSGLVAFSFHLQTTSTTIPTLHFPTPPRPKRSYTRMDGGEEADPNPEEHAQLYLPTTAHDLRFIQPDAEIWVWEPVHEIILSQTSSAKEAEVGMVEEQGEGEVKRALLCSRFAFML